MFVVLICGSESALLTVSAEVAEKRNTVSWGRVIFRGELFKRAVLCVFFVFFFLEGPLFLQAE